MGLCNKVKKFKGQDYQKLKKSSKGCLFTDPHFPPNDSSLSATPGKYGKVIWKRPKELCPNPNFFVGGVNRDDMVQGALGNCWFVAALSCLSSIRQYWNKVIPDYKNQEWNSKKSQQYKGIFKFQFWRFGYWTEVVIDDFLPTVNNHLIFIRSKTGGEFWSALLEKAYAKLFGSYEALEGGELNEALEDFTGGVSESIDLTALDVATNTVARLTLYQRLIKEIDRKTMMGASIPANSSEEMEAVTKCGLVKGHAYTISAVKDIALKGSGLFSFFNCEMIQMVRLRNPWGKKEWNGAFSDGSPEWEKIRKSDVKKIGLNKEDDGEFWMTFDDFCRHFQQLVTCNLVNTSIFSISKTWCEGMVHGAWTLPFRAGGCSNHPTFLSNPQYAFDVKDDQEEFMVQLMQKSVRKGKDSSHKFIGFKLFRVEWNRKFRIHKAEPHQALNTKQFTNSRSVFTYHNDVRKGRYIIIPAIFEPNQEGEFLLRVYTSSSSHLAELTQDIPVKSKWNCCTKIPVMVTYIKVIKATGLDKMDRSGDADPYCLIKCEGEKMTSRVEKNTVNPQWGDSAIFYRKNLKKPVILQVWNRNVMRDQFMGQHLLTQTAEIKEGEVVECKLWGRGKESNVQKSGILSIVLMQSAALDFM